MIEFLKEGNISMDKVYVHPIWESVSVHPHNDWLSLLYIYDIEGDREILINLNNIDNHTTTLEKFNFDFNECYVYDNKSLFHWKRGDLMSFCLMLLPQPRSQSSGRPR